VRGGAGDDVEVSVADGVGDRVTDALCLQLVQRRPYGVRAALDRPM
jgi:hypothetical protein